MVSPFYFYGCGPKARYFNQAKHLVQSKLLRLNPPKVTAGNAVLELRGNQADKSHQKGRRGRGTGDAVSPLNAPFLEGIFPNAACLVIAV